MTFQIVTRGDVLRYTARRVVVAVSLTVAMVTATTLLHLGNDFDAGVRAGDVIFNSICASMAISTVLAAGLAYRSALSMRDLTLTRSELARLSHTDQLTG